MNDTSFVQRRDFEMISVILCLFITFFCNISDGQAALLVARNQTPISHESKFHINKLFSSKSILWDVIINSETVRNESSQCHKMLNQVIKLYHESNVASTKMIDASGSIPNGLLEGTLANFGDFDECLSLRMNLNHSLTRHEIKGKHCIVKLKPLVNGSAVDGLENLWLFKNDFPLHIGLCIPNSCSNTDIDNILRKGLYPLYEMKDETYCDETKEPLHQINHLNLPQLLSIMYLGSMIFFVLANSVHDGYLRLKKCKLSKTASSISAISATFDLLTTNSEKFAVRKASIDVMRLVWVIIVVTAHAAFSGIEPRLIVKVARLDTDFAKFFEPLYMQPFFNAAVIEGFFYIGGFVTYISMHSKVVKENCSLTSFAVNRWLRFVPGMLSLMAIEQVWPLLASGPMMSEVRESIYKNCANGWWKNLIFMNNFDKLQNMCLTHTWYISADFQLFIMALIVVTILRAHRKTGLTLIYSIIFAGMFLTGWIAYTENHVPAITLANKDWWGFLDFIDYSYIPTTPHMTPYFIGILVGYYEKNTIKPMRKMLWVVCPIVFFSITFMPALWNTYKLDPNQYYSAVIYLTLYRFLWTASFAWGLSVLVKFVLQMTKKLKNIDPPGLPNTLLHLKESPRSEIVSILLGVSRLHFSLYMMHSIYVRWLWADSRNLFSFTFMDIFGRTVMLVGMSVIMSFFFYVFFESPFENLRKYIFNKCSE